MSTTTQPNLRPLAFINLSGSQQPVQAALRHMADALQRVRATLRRWRERSRSRRELLEMSEFQLRDIGLDASRASFEASKCFLRA